MRCLYPQNSAHGVRSFAACYDILTSTQQNGSRLPAGDGQRGQVGNPDPACASRIFESGSTQQEGAIVKAVKRKTAVPPRTARHDREFLFDFNEHAKDQEWANLLQAGMPDVGYGTHIIARGPQVTRKAKYQDHVAEMFGINAALCGPEGETGLYLEYDSPRDGHIKLHLWLRRIYHIANRQINYFEIWSPEKGHRAFLHGLETVELAERQTWAQKVMAGVLLLNYTQERLNRPTSYGRERVIVLFFDAAELYAKTETDAKKFSVTHFAKYLRQVKASMTRPNVYYYFNEYPDLRDRVEGRFKKVLARPKSVKRN
jgi:hypothetical protein